MGVSPLLALARKAHATESEKRRNKAVNLLKTTESQGQGRLVLLAVAKEGQVKGSENAGTKPSSS